MIKDFDALRITLFFLKREPMPSLETSKVFLLKTKILLHYVFGGKEGRAVFVNVVV